MDVQSIIKNLHPLEIRVLRAYAPGTELTADKLEKELNFKP
jgi:phenylalanyl-tRNA synthetase alpha chain